MKKQHLFRTSLMLVIVLSTALISCKKDKDDTPAPSRNTQLSEKILNEIPADIIKEANKLGLKINGGVNAPNIEGEYFASPVLLKNSNIEEDQDNIGEITNDGVFKFSEQNSSNQTILTYIKELNVSDDIGMGSLISGEGDLFTVFVVLENMYDSEVAYFLISGEVAEDGIKDFEFMLARDSGEARVFKDKDGLAERR